jgi:tRNA-Thr(GGU) m(6)t(6)A37 methyltransferase TsaA
LRKDAFLVFIGKVRRVEGELSTLEIFSDFEEAITGLDMFSHLIVLYWFHKRDDSENRRVLSVVPRRHRGATEMGVFGSRSPSRPNPLGHCVVKLLRRDGNLLLVKGMDAFKDSPLIDIKPYIPRADAVPKACTPNWTLSGPRS